MRTLFFFVIFILFSLSLQVVEPARYMVNDDPECRNCGGGSSSSSSSSSQSNKTKQFDITPKFIQCLKNTTAVPLSIINSISTKTYIYMTEEYEYVTSGYSQMTLNKINARFKFCAIVIEGPPATTRAEVGDYSCGNALGVTECFIEHLSEESGNDLENAYDARKVNTTNQRSMGKEEVVDDTDWKDQIVSALSSDSGYFVNCLEKHDCAFYIGYYLGYYDNNN